MSGKKSFVLRLDESMYKMLEKWAADEFRSVNGQLEWIIQQQLKSTGRLGDGKKKQQVNDGKSVSDIGDTG